MTASDHSTRPRFNPPIESPFGPLNRTIAKALFLTDATVKSHLMRIYRKLGTESHTAAVITEAHPRALIELDCGGAVRMLPV
jgi:Bacterial regulatory proteins, luxR family